MRIYLLVRFSNSGAKSVTTGSPCKTPKHNVCPLTALGSPLPEDSGAVSVGPGQFLCTAEG